MKQFELRYRISKLLSEIRVYFLRKRGVKIGDSVIIEGGVVFDKLYPSYISIGSKTLIARGVKIFSHDHCKRDSLDQPEAKKIIVGENCFIAGDSILLPGIRLGDCVIVGAGSVVTKSFPSNTIVAGNPARLVRSNVNISEFGKIVKVTW